MSENLTPMMQQYYRLKASCQDSILFFRMGDFYEIFGDDALEVAPKLDLVLTSRERGDQEKIPFCGVPHHSAANYYQKLLRMGYKVGFADQVEDPKKAKGLVKREITRILSPGTVDEIDALEGNEPCHIMAFYEDPASRKFATLALDFSTGECRLGNLTQEELPNFVALFSPREILCRKFNLDFWTKEESSSPWAQLSIKPCLAALPELELRDEKIQKKTIESFFAVKCLSELPCGSVLGGEALITSVMAYLGSLHLNSRHILGIKPLVDPECLILDETTRRDLELFYSARSQDKKFGLYHTINATLLPMGGRLLRKVLACPSSSEKEIKKRQISVQFFRKLEEQTHEEFRKILSKIGDFERLASRLSQMKLRPDELAKIGYSLNQLGKALGVLSLKQGNWPSLLSQLEKAAGNNQNLEKSILKTLKSEPGSLGMGRGVFNAGVDENLDSLLDLAENSQKIINEYEQNLRKKAGISSLKIKNHKTFGLLIEVTHTHTSKIPEDFVRRQTMVNCERYVTKELAAFNEQISSASEKLILAENELYQKYLREIAESAPGLLELSSLLGWVDLFQSFAWTARRDDFVCPATVSHHDLLILRGSRHPVVEKSIGKLAFVANSIEIDAKKSQLLLTGPNMAGKSTFMRQVAVSALLHQMGSFVPAREARLPIFDRIFTRIGASDDLAMGDSTFLVEMKEAARILRQATPKSLVIIDEIGRGTSTHDGLGLANAILEDFACRVKSWTFFATHFHELVESAKELPAVRCIQTMIKKDGDKLILTHQIAEGASGVSYGLEAARLAGIPDHVLERAKVLTAQASVFQKDIPVIIEASEVELQPDLFEDDGSLFGRPLVSQVENKAKEIDPLHKKIRSFNVNRMRPVDALLALDELVQMLGTREHQQTDLFSNLSS